MRTVEVIEQITSEPIKALGYELVDVEFIKEQSEWVLTLYIDKDGGVNIEDCEKVSKAVEPLIDEADPISQSYFLSVSSPGLDRPLKNARDYERFIGKAVTVKLYAKQDGKKDYTGELSSYTDETLTLLTKDGKSHEFILKNIAQIKPFIEF